MPLNEKIPLSVKLGGKIIRQRREQQYDALQQQDFFLCNRSGTGYGRDFQNSEYSKLKKVYSIWICSNSPKDYQNSISTYKVTEELNVGGKPREKNYDLLATIMIGLGKSGQDNYDGVLKFLGTLLSGEIQPEQKEEILRNEFNVVMSKEMKEEAGIMCNLSQGIFQTGIEKGKAEDAMETKKEMALSSQVHDLINPAFCGNMKVQ